MEPDLFEVAKTESSTKPATRHLRSLALAGRLGLRLMVVFVGVYAAFALSEYRAAQRVEAVGAAVRVRQRAEIPRLSVVVEDDGLVELA